MAYVDVVPASLSIQVVQGIKKKASIAVFDSAGAAVNLSAFNAFSVKAFPPAGAGSAALPLSSTTAVAGTATGFDLTLAIADTVNMLPGSYTINVMGKSTSGDELQLLGVGTLNVLRDA